MNDEQTFGSQNIVCTQPLERLGALICGDAVAADLVVAHGVLPLFAGVGHVALHGVDDAALAPLHDAHMVGKAVYAVAGPIQKDDVAGVREVVPVGPLTPVLEPLFPDGAPGELGDDAGLDIAALLGAPTDEAGAPFHPAGEAVP